MATLVYTCGHCKGTRFPEGMFIDYCPVCQTYFHPGCWDAHVVFHRQQEDVTSDHLEPRLGKISAYGIIQWDN